MWGYSGGSMASGFAAKLQQSYAPELDIAGAALGGTVPQIAGNTQAINQSPFVGLVPPSVIGLSNEYPEVADALSNMLVPKKRDAFMQAANQCIVANILQFFGDDLYSYLKGDNGFSRFAPIIKENSMG
jgi:hypothetical protein